MRFCSLSFGFGFGFMVAIVVVDVPWFYSWFGIPLGTFVIWFMSMSFLRQIVK